MIINSDTILTHGSDTYVHCQQFNTIYCLQIIIDNKIVYCSNLCTTEIRKEQE